MARTRALLGGLVVLVLAMTTAPALAQSSPPAASYSRAAMSKAEQKDFPHALGKVTKAGMVSGTIPAKVGDFVLGPCDQVPDEYAGPPPGCDNGTVSFASTAAVAAATVLHADELTVVPAGTNGNIPARFRMYSAWEENTSNDARAYWRQRLVYGSTSDYDWNTYHEQGQFRVHFSDESATAGDGCGTYAQNWSQCTWLKDPNGIRGDEGDSPQATYVVTGTYRPKGNGNDTWGLNLFDVYVWQPYQNQWLRYWNCTGDHWRQALGWRVGDNSQLAPSDICPYPIGSNP